MTVSVPVSGSARSHANNHPNQSKEHRLAYLLDP